MLRARGAAAHVALVEVEEVKCFASLRQVHDPRLGRSAAGSSRRRQSLVGLGRFSRVAPSWLDARRGAIEALAAPAGGSDSAGLPARAANAIPCPIATASLLSPLMTFVPRSPGQARRGGPPRCCPNGRANGTGTPFSVTPTAPNWRSCATPSSNSASSSTSSGAPATPQPLKRKRSATRSARSRPAGPGNAAEPSRYCAPAVCSTLRPPARQSSRRHRKNSSKRRHSPCSPDADSGVEKAGYTVLGVGGKRLLELVVGLTPAANARAGRRRRWPRSCAGRRRLVAGCSARRASSIRKSPSTRRNAEKLPEPRPAHIELGEETQGRLRRRRPSAAAQRAGRARGLESWPEHVRGGAWGPAGNGALPATSRVPVPASAGDPVSGSASRVGAFRARTARSATTGGNGLRVIAKAACQEPSKMSADRHRKLSVGERHSVPSAWAIEGLVGVRRGGP